MEKIMVKSPVEIWKDGPPSRPVNPDKADIREYMLWLQGQTNPSGSGTGIDFARDLAAHVNDKSNPHHVTADQLGLGDIDERIGVNVPLYGDRPGDSSRNFVDVLTGGDPVALPALAAGSQATDENGRVRRLAGAGVIATRAMYPLEPNKVYLVEFVVQRRVDTPDPSNDAVRCAIAWYNQGQGVLTPAFTTVRDITTLVVGAGRIAVTARISRTAGDETDIVAPVNARYARPFVQTYGTSTVTDVEVTRWVDITNAVTYSPDLTALEGRVSAIESLDLGPRVIALEEQVTAPSTLRVDTAGSIVSATVPVSVDIIETLGYYRAGDGGHCSYVRAASEPLHGLKWKSADGSWWEIVSKGSLDARCAGYIADSDATTGNGTDNSAALQRAIDFIAPFIWQGTTRDTELKSSTGGTVILPTGIGRCASKIRWAPNLRIRGEASGNDFTVRTGVAGVSSGLDRMGSGLFMDIADFSTYAIDTSPYDATGARVDNYIQKGYDSSSGLHTQVPNIDIDDVTIYGNWTCKGINLAGAESCHIGKNVLIRGFTVGIRASACWYSRCEARILHNWRGFIAQYCTDFDITGTSVWKPIEAPVYDPTVSGFDGSEPPNRTTFWTDAVLKRTASIYNNYSCLTASTLTVELGDYQFMNFMSVNDFKGIYTEQSAQDIIFSAGPDQQNEKYSFKTIGPAANNAVCFASVSDARIAIEVLDHNYTSAGFSKMFRTLSNAIGAIGKPTLKRVRLTGADTVTDAQIRYGDLKEEQQNWTPVPKFGGVAADAGAGVKNGRWDRIGNRIFIVADVNIATLSGATGAFTIDGLPYPVRNSFGQDGCAVLSFFFGTPTLRVGRAAAGSSAITFDGITNTGFVNGAEIRLSMDYLTDSGDPN